MDSPENPATLGTQDEDKQNKDLIDETNHVLYFLVIFDTKKNTPQNNVIDWYTIVREVSKTMP